MTGALMIIAIIIGPIMAVQIQKLLERRRQKRQAKEGIFKTLMSTRGTPVSLLHVQALNLIDLEFYGTNKKDKTVVDAWKMYRDHLYNHPNNSQEPDYKSKSESWGDKSRDLLTDLLFEMAQSLGYEFDKVHLKRGAYTPQVYGDTEFEQLYLRRKLVALFEGKTAIPISIRDEYVNKQTRNPPEKHGESCEQVSQ